MAAPLYHRPVLVDEAVKQLLKGGHGLYLDGTLGGGGHSHAILTACPDCRVLGVDQDPDAIAEARQRLSPFEGRVRFVESPFEDAIGDLARTERPEEEGLAGVLLDLGVSSHQLDADPRGFTIRRGVQLDMRMDPTSGPGAQELLAEESQARLTEIFRAGEAPKAGLLAKRIVRRRARSPIQTSDDLVGLLESVLSRPATHNEKARTFQALRIAVNDEIGTLERTLPLLKDALRPGGTLVVISYHSLEDGVVKRAFREWSDPSHGLPPRLPVRAAELRAQGSLLTPKPVSAGPEEVALNPRARPAKLRAWRRAA
ncbi:MAG: 16S rRNA (cytosine(1402)-N(4))-methyltransferase RsmH [Longimicrobiales bacterium]